MYCAYGCLDVSWSSRLVRNGSEQSGILSGLHVMVVGKVQQGLQGYSTLLLVWLAGLGELEKSGILKGFSWLGLGDGSKGMELRIGHVVSGCVHMRVVAGRQVCK